MPQTVALRSEQVIVGKYELVHASNFVTSFVFRLMIKTYLALLVVALLTTCVGCGDDTPPLGQLTGVVTIDGKPFAGGSLQFIPEGGGRPSVAVTDENGEFEALYLVGKTGALIGSHKVLFEINDTADVAEEDQFMPPAGSKKGPKSYRITPDVIEVASGSNEIELKLST